MALMASVVAHSTNGVKMVTTSQAYLEGSLVSETKVLISDLCRQFYNLGWISGTGTGDNITIKVHDTFISKPHQLIVMSPSGVQKERMIPEDMYVMSLTGTILFSSEPKPYPHKASKCSDCAPFFPKVDELIGIKKTYFLVVSSLFG